MKSVAVVLNPEKVKAVELAREVVPWLEGKGVLVIVEKDAANAIGMPQLSRDEKILAKADFAVIMGGDGTLLRASRTMVPAGVPMLPVRFGRFGFLCDTEPGSIYQVLTEVLEGRYTLDERMMLRSFIRRGTKKFGTSHALNDVVIAKGPLARLLRLGTSVSGKPISEYAADGLIVATPTGSTAYSLSAGGPVVSPELKVMLITPICSHTLNTRSLIVSSRHTIEIRVDSDLEEMVMLTVDGQLGIELKRGDIVNVTESRYKAKLIQVGDLTFYDKLQTRLRWGGRFDL